MGVIPILLLVEATGMFALAAVLSIAADPVGWPDVFPALGNFDRKVANPVIARGDKPEVYSQAATYEWMGGRFEILTLTIARDPGFKKKYELETVKQGKPAPEVIEVNKKPAYLWTLARADELDKVSKRLVVILADDKVLIVEQRGFGLELPEVAKKLDFEKVLKALETPPPAR